MDFDCRTVMSSCWSQKTAPEPADALTVKTVYGIPHNLSINKVNNIGLTRVSFKNRSTYYTYFKWDGSQAVFILSRYVYGTFSIGSLVSIEDNLLTLYGPGLYKYQATVSQQFPNGATGDQFGGQTDWLQIDPAPYKLFLPAILKP